MKRVTAFAVLLVVLAAPAWADWDEGVAAHDRGDYATALREFRVLAEQGDADAQYNLALMYAKGQGVPEDYAEAVKWYRKAAAQGKADAQFNLGVMYDNGWGVPQDYVQAVKWYRNAADQGYANAQNNLGAMYHAGEGVPQDYAEAVKWFRKAAEQGYAGAEFNLGAMYRNGLGVPQDYVQAHMWLNLAAAGSPPGEDRDQEPGHCCRAYDPRPNCRGAAPGGRVATSRIVRRDPGQLADLWHARLAVKTLHRDQREAIAAVGETEAP